MSGLDLEHFAAFMEVCIQLLAIVDISVLSTAHGEGKKEEPRNEVAPFHQVFRTISASFILGVFPVQFFSLE